MEEYLFIKRVQNFVNLLIPLKWENNKNNKNKNKNNNYKKNIRFIFIRLLVNDHYSLSNVSAAFFA